MTKPTDGACKAASLTYDAEHLSRTQAAQIIDREAVTPAVREYRYAFEDLYRAVTDSTLADMQATADRYRHLIEESGE